MKKIILLILALILAISLVACTKDQYGDVLKFFNTEPIETRDWSEVSELMRDARFLRRRLPLKKGELDAIDYALGITSMLYYYHIDGLKRATVVRRVKNDFGDINYTFKIVDKHGDTYFVDYSGITTSIWKIGEDGNGIILYPAMSWGQ